MEQDFFGYRTFNRVKVTFELSLWWVYINLAISFLYRIRPPDFERSPYGMGIRMVRRIGGLVGDKKGLICKALKTNGL